MRIIGGIYRGRRLSSPKTTQTRPTGDRAREGIFNILDSLLTKDDREFNGTRVLDLFAGTGAFGFESLSRGAQYAAFVDDAIEAVKIIHENGDNLSIDPGQYRIFRRDATKLPVMTDPYDMVFLDAPYGENLTHKTLNRIHQGGYLKIGTLIIVEVSVREEFTAPPWFFEKARATYGAASVIIGCVTFIGKEP